MYEIRRPWLLIISTAYIYKLPHKSYSGASHPFWHTVSSYYFFYGLRFFKYIYEYWQRLVSLITIQLHLLPG